jgi:hypothetical protein
MRSSVCASSRHAGKPSSMPYLDRPKAQLATLHDLGPRPFVYGIGQKGARALREYGSRIDAGVDWSEKNKRSGYRVDGGGVSEAALALFLLREQGAGTLLCCARSAMLDGYAARRGDCRAERGVGCPQWGMGGDSKICSGPAGTLQRSRSLIRLSDGARRSANGRVGTIHEICRRMRAYGEIHA